MTISRIVGGALALTALGCGKKNMPPPAPPVGWHQEPEGWAFACYHPPNWAALPEVPRKQARSTALDEMMTQWGGDREDGVAFTRTSIEEVEMTLLGRPEAIESVVLKNLQFCKAMSTGQADSAAWDAWFRGLEDVLTDGECVAPLLDTIFDYLDIQTGWQRSFPICEGNKIRVSGTLKDRYRVREDGPWITVVGDPDLSTSGNTDFPCNQEGCFEGGLMFRFTSLAGVETIIPVPDGQLLFTAPEHGTISYRINDTTYYDNKWYQGGGIEDHTAVEVSPQ
jgi:hypothetical protein